MTCQDCEFALGCEQSSAAIAEHLRACPACRQLTDDLLANAEAFESMSAEEMPRVPVKVGRPVLPAAIGAFAIAAVYRSMGIKTSIDVPEGQKIVVGKSSVPGGDDALILVLSVKIVK
jgi:hypothetical protein